MRGSSSARMSTHDSGVNNHAFHVGILGEVTAHPLPDTLVGPSHESFAFGFFADVDIRAVRDMIESGVQRE
jgi:hypothetical protein